MSRPDSSVLPAAGAPHSAHSSFWQSMVWMVLVALALRLIVMGFLYDEQIDPYRDHWRFAYEVGRIARSIVQGQGIASPLYDPTGPSAWMTPIYPYMLAGIFKLFGTYSTASALVALSLQSLLSALNVIPIVLFARYTFGQRVATVSGWAWALFPYAIYFPVERIWATWLATLLLSILFLMTLRLERPRSYWVWAGYGALWGFLALTEPITLSVLPILLGWPCYRLLKTHKPWFLRASTAVLMLTLFVTPWFVRNYVVFHQFIPFRDTMGLEMIIGNNGQTFHWRPTTVGPWHNDEEYNEFRQNGELAYMAHKKQQAIDFVAAHPGFFAIQTVRRFTYIWTGYWSFDPKYLEEEPFDIPNIFFSSGITILMLLGLRRLFREQPDYAWLYAGVFLLFPLIFYFTHPEVYYRRQIDPMCVVLAVYAVLPLRKQESQGVVALAK